MNTQINKYTTSIVDDEPLARQRIRRMLQGKPNIEIIAECKNGKEAIRSIQNSCPDLLFLDIQLKDLTGFQVLDQIKVKPRIVIFITSYDEYAIKAFEYCALDYLLKPIMLRRFDQAYQRAIQQLENNNGDADVTKDLKKLIEYFEAEEIKQNFISPKINLPIRIGDRIQLLPIEDIQYFIASSGYIEVYTHQKKHLLRDSFLNLLPKLPSDNFQRIHRSFCINIRFLEEIKSLPFGLIEVKMKDGKTLKVSKSYKAELLLKIGL